MAGGEKYNARTQESTYVCRISAQRNVENIRKTDSQRMKHHIENAALHKIRHNQNKIPNGGHKVNWQKQLKTTAVQPPNSFAPNRFEYIYTQLFVAATRAANILSHSQP